MFLAFAAVAGWFWGWETVGQRVVIFKKDWASSSKTRWEECLFANFHTLLAKGPCGNFTSDFHRQFTWIPKLCSGILPEQYLPASFCQSSPVINGHIAQPLHQVGKPNVILSSWVVFFQPRLKYVNKSYWFFLHNTTWISQFLCWSLVQTVISSLAFSHSFPAILLSCLPSVSST